MTQTAEKTQNGGVPALRPELRTGGAVAAIVPQNIEQAHRMATAICAAGMAPKSYDRSVEKVLVGILHGMEVGMTPLNAIQSIAVINGMPSIWGDGALGLILGSGLVEDFDEHYEKNDDGQIVSAVCIIERKGRKTPIIGKFTYEDAIRAKLTKKQGPWQDYPDRMLKMRARGFALRDGFADVLRGLHIAEEVMDTPGQDVTYTPRPARSNYEDAKSETLTESDDPATGSDTTLEAMEAAGATVSETEEAEAEVVVEGVDPDPAAQYRVALVNKPNAQIPDWLKFRNDVLALAKKLGPDAIQHIEAANADAFEEMAGKSKVNFDDMWRGLGGMTAAG